MITKIHLRNVKGVSGCFDLGKVTNLYGPNGSGKSAILEGLKIGLTGYTELGKAAGKTLQLSSDKTMEITLESALGRTLTRKFERSGSGAKQTITLNGEVVPEKDLVMPSCFQVPVESIHPSEFLALSGEKRADFVFSSLPAEINSISPEDLKEKFPFFEKTAGFSEVLEMLKGKKSEYDQEIKRCLANIQKLTGEMGELPAGNLQEWEEKKKAAAEDLEKTVKEISSNEERVRLAGSKADQVARLEKNIRESAQKIDATEKSIVGLQACVLPIPTCKNLQILELEKVESSKALTVAKTTKTDLDSRLAVLTEKGCCPFCNALAVSLEDSMNEWELRSFNLGAEIEILESSLSELESDIEIAKEAKHIETANIDFQRSIKIDQDAIKSYRKFNAECAEALAKLNSDNDNAPASVEILQGKSEGLRLLIKEADENIKKFVSIQSVRNQKSKSETERMQLENDLENVKAALESVKNLRDSRLSDATVSLATPFRAIVSAAFGCPSFIALMSANDKPCFDFGLVRNNKEISYDTLSGGEKTIMLSALVACIQIIKTGRAGVGLFELAEADEKSVEGLVRAAEIVEFEQIVIASCHGSEIQGATNIAMEVQQ
jgi:DNA repair exonuclease SbcCD ATPase subunit